MKIFQDLQLNALNSLLIEPLNTPDLLQQLKKDLASNKFSPSAKQNKINRITGFCSVCHGLPEYFMIYDCNGVSTK
jgi:hypothetical protein